LCPTTTFQKQNVRTAGQYRFGRAARHKSMDAPGASIAFWGCQYQGSIMARLTSQSWAEIQVMYETSDISNAKIGEMYGVSGVMVGRKAKQGNWTRPKLPESLAETSLIKTTQGSEVGKRSEDTLTQFLSVLAVSGDKKLACGAAGITEQTVANWCNEDPKLLDEMTRARSRKLAELICKIADSKDWKAALKLLQVAPETKEQFSDRRKDEGPTIILNIHRDEVVIEQPPIDVTPDIESSQTLESAEEPETKRPGDVDVPQKEATETATESPQSRSIIESPFPPRDPEGARERDRLEKERMDKCWMGADWREKHGLSE